MVFIRPTWLQHGVLPTKLIARLFERQLSFKYRTRRSPDLVNLALRDRMTTALYVEEFLNGSRRDVFTLSAEYRHDTIVTQAGTRLRQL